MFYTCGNAWDVIHSNILAGNHVPVCWFGTPFICEEEGLKHKLVAHLEKHLIQTRNYFSGNILMHPGFAFLDNYKKYPEANRVLDKVFFIGAAPHYTDEIFNYIEDVVKKF